MFIFRATFLLSRFSRMRLSSSKLLSMHISHLLELLCAFVSSRMTSQASLASFSRLSFSAGEAFWAISSQSSFNRFHPESLVPVQLKRRCVRWLREPEPSGLGFHVG